MRDQPGAKSSRLWEEREEVVRGPWGKYPPSCSGCEVI